jgi:dihydrofolate synthase/folylpolyglutamate synthase
MSQHIGLPYQKALDFWFSSINYEQRVPQPDDLKLDRMRALLGRLGDPQDRLRIIHVAGSKGKGSTSAMLSAILRQAGYRTGLFTSPHLCRVEERFQIDGQLITAEELTTLLEEVRKAADARAVPATADPSESALAPTFFEIATAVSFLHFLRRRVDVAIVEVGLGGRFDSTNVCLPEVALVTSISFDHTRQLGNRLESIAMEKAGIVKPRRPAISGARDPAVRTVIERICRERQAPLQQLDVDFRYSYEPGQIADHGTASPIVRSPRVQVTTRERSWPALELGLLGDHQAANAAVAVACIEQLRRNGWNIPDHAVAKGLAGVCWPARLEVLGLHPLTVLDCAHNVASAEALVSTLQVSFPPTRRLLVFACSNDKDVAGIFRTLAPHFAHAFVTRYGNNPRSVPPQELAQLLQRNGGLDCTVCSSSREAWHACRKMARPEDLICVTGSVFLAGELRPLLAGDEDS